MERTIGSKIWLTHRWALYSSSMSGLLSARNESMSFRSRRAWFSWASSPVRRSSRRWWCPASTTLGWSWMVEPFWVVLIAYSSTSKPELVEPPDAGGHAPAFADSKDSFSVSSVQSRR